MQLTLRSIGHRYGAGPWLFQNLSAEFEPGQLWSVTGPSGSGKSTLLGLLAGWDEPTTGRIERHGVASSTWVPQNPFGVSRRSALDHVVLALLARGLPRDQAEQCARTALSRFGISTVADQRFGSLSGGEAQRLMLARASISSANLLLVDEPTAQLDATSAQQVIRRLGELADEGRIVVIATHDPRVAAVCGHDLGLGVAA